MYRFLTPLFACLMFAASALAADSGESINIDANNPWYPHAEFPAWKTPQWVAEDGVEAVVILSIDDMNESAKYEQYLRPILNRLKKIDGRAPLSIMTCSVKPDDPQLQVWLAEGLSIDVHTVDHPCPLLRDGDFEKAKSTYDRCVDMLFSVQGNKPVAFRTPCCDSQNTVSPRFFSTIFSRTTEKQNYLQADSSVFVFYTAADKSIPRSWVIDDEGKDRFLKYIPQGLKYGGVEHNHFVNRIDNYPYPYVIGDKCWEFPCMGPSDWSAQHLSGVNKQQTVDDWKIALDITVMKQGVMSLVFHPHGWIESKQIVELIDHAQRKHGSKVKFLTFADSVTRLNNSLTGGKPLRECDDQTLARVSFRKQQRHIKILRHQLPKTLQSRFRDVVQASRFVDINEDGVRDMIVSLDGKTEVWLRDLSSQHWDKQLTVPASVAKKLLPVVKADGSDNGFFVFDAHLCWQNEETSGLNDLIQSVAIADLFKKQ